MKHSIDHWQRRLIERYRKKLGCNSNGNEICWCEKCVTIERIIDDTAEHIVKLIENDYK